MTVEVRFTIAHNISSSKGWGRYAASTATGKLVQSSTGNEWVSVDHSGSTEPGTEIRVKLQRMKRTKKGREEVYTDEYRLIAREGATTELGYWDGLQVVVWNAELVA